MSRSVWLTRAGIALLTTVSAGVWATPALAASTGTARVVSATKIDFKAAGSKVNNVVITRSGRTVTIDDRVAIKAGKGCKAIKGDKTRVKCKTKKNPSQVRVELGNLNDAVRNKTSIRVLAYGGSGNDSLSGGSGHDSLYGENGQDKIWGGAGHDLINTGSGGGVVSDGTGNDKVFGGRGDDKFLAAAWTGRADNDSYAGGGGEDQVSYASRTAPVRADSDGVTGDDGQRGERDTIRAGIVAIEGGRGNDRLYGTAVYNRLFGGPGNDLLSGLAGDDQLVGGTGNDRLLGGDGWDSLAGGAGKDRLEGGAGNDVLTGDQSDAVAVTPAADVLLGGEGVDLVAYSVHPRGVRVTLLGRSDNGAPGEGDTIGTDIENIAGSEHSDQLFGNDGPNEILGNGSNPGPGDRIEGGGGNDHLLGGRHTETIKGGTGDDVIDASGAYDDDAIDTVDGGEHATIGDRCLTDAVDVVTNCELGRA